MAAVSLFFHDGVMLAGTELWLNEETAEHVTRVLRMKEGDPLQLTDGKGNLADCAILSVHKKKCSVQVTSVQTFARRATGLHLAVAFTKNASRNEWILEKVTEMGVESIIPLKTARTEREHIRFDRWNNILTAAILQSQQYYLPLLTQPQTIEALLKNTEQVRQKLIAHCITDSPKQAIAKSLDPGKETLILIGPEGDFTKEEVMLCEAANFAGISLGATRLRTETAAVMAAACFNMINYEQI